MESHNWLIIEELDFNLSKQEIFEKLYQMLLSTNKVLNMELLKKDLDNKSKNVCPFYSENTYFCHTQSNWVSDFCASLIILPENKQFCISAWPDYSEQSLSKIYTLTEKLKIIDKI